MGTREFAIFCAALLAGVGIALVDQSRGYDATGGTAISMVIVAASITYLGRGRPWLWALAVSAPTVVIGLAGGADLTILLSIVFAAIGAAFGWALWRTATKERPPAD
jgi:hypothetical protein